MLKEQRTNILQVYEWYNKMDIIQWISQCNQDVIQIFLQNIDLLSSVDDYYAQFLYFSVIYGILNSKPSEKVITTVLTSFIQNPQPLYLKNNSLYVQIMDVLTHFYYDTNQELIVNLFLSSLQQDSDVDCLLFKYQLYFHYVLTYNLPCYKLLKYFYNHNVQFNETLVEQIENVQEVLSIEEQLPMLQILINNEESNAYVKSFCQSFIKKLESSTINDYDAIKDIVQEYENYLTTEDVRNLDKIYFDSNIKQQEFLVQKLIFIICRVFDL